MIPTAPQPRTAQPRTAQRRTAQRHLMVARPATGPGFNGGRYILRESSPYSLASMDGLEGFGPRKAAPILKPPVVAPVVASTIGSSLAAAKPLNLQAFYAADAAFTKTLNVVVDPESSSISATIGGRRVVGGGASIDTLPGYWQAYTVAVASKFPAEQAYSVARIQQLNKRDWLDTTIIAVTLAAAAYAGVAVVGAYAAGAAGGAGGAGGAGTAGAEAAVGTVAAEAAVPAATVAVPTAVSSGSSIGGYLAAVKTALPYLSAAKAAYALATGNPTSAPAQANLTSQMNAAYAAYQDKVAQAGYSPVSLNTFQSWVASGAQGEVPVGPAVAQPGENGEYATYPAGAQPTSLLLPLIGVGLIALLR